MNQTQVRYLVFRKETCPTCKGSGWMEHPLWTEYFNEYCVPFTKEHGRLPTDEQTETWWSEMGFGPKEIPPQEVECHVCNGTGVVHTKVSLEDAPAPLRLMAGVVDEGA